jgi:hypothetical protein
VWLFSVLPNQHGQVLTEAEAVLVAAATLAVAAVVAALLAGALVRRQPFTVAAFAQRQPSGVHTLPAEVSAGLVAHRKSTTVAQECRP